MKIIDLVNFWVGKIVKFWVIALMLIMVFEVVARYIFNSPTSWANELSQYIFATMWVLAGGYVLSTKSMVNMDIFYSKLNIRKKAICDISTSAFAFIFTGALLWQSLLVSINSVKWHEVSGTIWNPPIYPIRIALALGTFLLLIQIISELLKNIRILRTCER